MSSYRGASRIVLIAMRALAVFTTACALLAATTAEAQPLNFFKNYFITGDYVVAGVGLDRTGSGGLVSGTVNLSGVPDGAEAVAAFLYWQVVSSNGPDTGALTARFNGQLLSTPSGLDTASGPLAVVGNQNGTVACPLTGGGFNNRVYAYRADVLRFLDLVNGRYRLSGQYTVQVPDGGGPNQMPRAIGASLVIVYRSPDVTAPLNAIVMYDGNYTKQSGQTMSQTIEGYYDPAPVPGKITHIVGSGQATLAERVTVPGYVYSNPFRGAQGNAWDNPTLTTAPLAADSFVTSVQPQGFAADCLTWGAIIYRTQVNDADSDGLLDKWESSSNTLYDPTGAPLPNLYAMGANKNHKDVFVEIGYMSTATSLSYGGAVKPAHSHLPTGEALREVGDAFKNAPVSNPDGLEGIDIHFDVGLNYPSGVADPYVIRNGEPRGGEAIDESATVCSRGAGDPPWVCQFSDYPGTVGWKSGFRFLRDDWVDDSTGAPLGPAAATACDASGTCRQRFDAVRKDMFRYVLFAHALGVPKADCLGADGFPDAACQDTNPLFHVPVTNTGVADFPGGDGMVSLGAFNDPAGNPVGTDYMQAATLMHELGHTFELRHGGAIGELNCKPNYLSVMNYLFQLRGLLDDQGHQHLDYSGQVLAGFNELSLTDPGGLGLDIGTLAPPRYRTGWYAPQGPGTIGSAATLHCDGSPLLVDSHGVPIEPPMVRVNSKTVAGTYNALDWNFAPTPPAAGGQDVNFDGSIGPLNPGTNDWATLRLNQLGTRRNVGGWYWVWDPALGTYEAFMGPLSLDVGRGDLGRGDLGRGDLGRGDLGRGDLGRGDLGRGDLGRGDLGRGDLGRGDLGRGDLGRGDLGRGDLGRGDLGDGTGEVTDEIAAASGYGPPIELKAWVRGTNGAGTNSSLPGGWVPVGGETSCATLSPADCHRVRLDWTAPSAGAAGTPTGYTVYRSVDDGTKTVVPGTIFQTALGHFALIDNDELPNGSPVEYTATATFLVNGQPKESEESNAADINSVNTPPVVTNNPQSVGGLEDNAVPITVAATDEDTTVLAYNLVAGSGPTHGTLSGSLPSVTYNPNLNSNSDDGPESFKFTAHEASTWNNLGQDSAQATVNIAITPVNDAPSFTAGANQTVTQPAGAQSVSDWATNIERGPLNTSNEDSQAVDFIVTNNNNALFSVQPAVEANGTLTYTPASGASGVATVTVKLHDNGGTANSGADTSGSKNFTITVNPPPYTLVNVSNLPPRSGATFRTSSRGTLVSFEFELKKNGVLIAIGSVAPRITITGPAGWTTATYAPGCSSSTAPAGCSGFYYESREKAWEFNWKPVNLPVGTYYVTVYIGQTGQSFPATGGFPVVVTR